MKLKFEVCEIVQGGHVVITNKAERFQGIKTKKNLNRNPHVADHGGVSS